MSKKNKLSTRRKQHEFDLKREKEEKDLREKKLAAKGTKMKVDTKKSKSKFVKKKKGGGLRVGAASKKLTVKKKALTPAAKAKAAQAMDVDA